MARYAKFSSTELIAACAGPKDEAAWVEFIRRFHVVIAAAVLRTARGWGEPSRSQLDDLIQDTYLKLCENNSRLLPFSCPGRKGKTAFRLVRSAGTN